MGFQVPGVQLSVQVLLTFAGNVIDAVAEMDEQAVRYQRLAPLINVLSREPDAIAFSHLLRRVGPFLAEVLLSQNISDRTVVQYRIAYRQWHEYMTLVGRHPACPNVGHVRGFAHWLQDERDNGAIATIKQKLDKLDRAYRFWQQEPTLPHPQHYNPFSLAAETIQWEAFEDTEEKPIPFIPLQRLQEILQTISDLRDLVPVLTQLKLGVRVGELRNI